MKLHRTIAATTRVAGVLLAFGIWGAAIAEAQTTDPRVADLVRAGKLRVGLFLPQYGKGPDGLRLPCGSRPRALTLRVSAFRSLS